MTVRVGVMTETTAGEGRVAIVPDGVRALVRGGFQVAVQRGAGARAYCTDNAYAAAGGSLADDIGQMLGSVDVIAKIQRPNSAEIGRIKKGTVVLALLNPASSTDALGQLAGAGATALALELVPRISRAQSMDVLSSQSTVAGYKAVLIAADAAPRFLPMLTTAAGSLAPAKVFVLGAGVAGLQAIATARRLGAVVSAFNVRTAAQEQVLSLGATFVAAEAVAADGESQGGYAREQSEDQQRRTANAIAKHIADMDIVITTAQVPGRAAPRLVTAAMVASMRPGSIIVDLAAESGGNCELTRAGETVESGGVRVMGPVNIASTVPYHASRMFSKNVVTLLQHITKDGNLTIDLADPITGAMAVTHGGTVRTPGA